MKTGVSLPYNQQKVTAQAIHNIIKQQVMLFCYGWPAVEFDCTCEIAPCPCVYILSAC